LSVTFSLSACDDSRHVPRTSDYELCPVFHEAPYLLGIRVSCFLCHIRPLLAGISRIIGKQASEGFTLALGVKECLLLAFVADFLFDVI
jgi:hypothetical protein